MHTHIHMCLYVYSHIRMCTTPIATRINNIFIHTRTHTHTYTCMHEQHIQTHTHTHIHTCMHACTAQKPKNTRDTHTRTHTYEPHNYPLKLNRFIIMAPKNSHHGAKNPSRSASVRSSNFAKALFCNVIMIMRRVVSTALKAKRLPFEHDTNAIVMPTRSEALCFSRTMSGM